MGGGGKIMTVRRWSWVVAAKLWLVVDARGWWWQNYGWLWMVVGGRGWSWMVARFNHAH